MDETAKARQRRLTFALFKVIMGTKIRCSVEKIAKMFSVPLFISLKSNHLGKPRGYGLVVIFLYATMILGFV